MNPAFRWCCQSAPFVSLVENLLVPAKRLSVKFDL
jgi:hypothetical protein